MYLQISGHCDGLRLRRKKPAILAQVAAGKQQCAGTATVN